MSWCGEEVLRNPGVGAPGTFPCTAEMPQNTGSGGIPVTGKKFSRGLRETFSNGLQGLTSLGNAKKNGTHVNHGRTSVLPRLVKIRNLDPVLWSSQQRPARHVG